ncbi:hypothetical protein LL01C2_41950 [Escherichia coli]
MVIPSKVTLEGSDGSEAKLAVTVSEGPSRMGETASALHLFNSLIKEHSKIFCSCKKTEISSGIVISHQEAS